VRSTSFFLLPAQGLCDREPAARIGSVIEETIRSIDSSLTSNPPDPRIAADGRIRIGLLSGCYRAHSNWKSHLAWLVRLDPSRFEVIGFSTQSRKGPEFDEARSWLARMEVVPSDPIGLARRVREEQLHAVILPEIGMDPTIRITAAARLAPIQWCSWGHATTSGYASVNGYLSAAFMESEDADAHYTEPLIRLPGVGCSFVRPAAAPDPMPRSSLGVGDGEVAVWCAHAPFTHLPQHDSVLTRIADRCPNARFIFVAMESGDPVRARIETALRAQGLEADRYLRFLPRMPISQFLGANAACDFYLDTPEWSGCNTGLETILMGCPPITLPGRFMRGRHLWAFLQQMQMPELAAWSVDEYIELAVRMIGDAGMRRDAAKSIAERRDVLFEDPAPRVACEDLLEQACRRL
jgi:protein O-GlcNAc transferase